MRHLYLTVLALFVAFSGIFLTASAQESSSELESLGDKSALVLEETTPVDSVVTLRPLPAQPQGIVPHRSTEKQQGQENSVLSFNFLYYFIQKFKMSDIVDD